jgi:hypothetical protein
VLKNFSTFVQEKHLTRFSKTTIVSTVEGGRWMWRQAAVIPMIAACLVKEASAQGFASWREITNRTT